MRNRTTPILCLLLPALAAHAQYVGKVGQGEERKPTLRATAVYEYTGSMTAPSASRLVPVVVWDGTNYQPGGLYLAQPEPLAVAPGTQYVLEQSGVPAGLFNLGGAGQLNGSWVGLGRYAPNIAPPAPRKLAASRKPPAITAGPGEAVPLRRAATTRAAARCCTARQTATPEAARAALPAAGARARTAETDRPCTGATARRQTLHRHKPNRLDNHARLNKLHGCARRRPAGAAPERGRLGDTVRHGADERKPRRLEHGRVEHGRIEHPERQRPHAAPQERHRRHGRDHPQP